MKPVTLRSNPALDDATWEFTFPPSSLSAPSRRPGVILGKMISLHVDAITLRVEQFPSNRVLNSDDPTKFVLLSIDKRFRFPEQPMKVAVDYVLHSHHFQTERTILLSTRSKSDKELDDRIYNLGEFRKIMNVAKRAKRIGLLFSSAQIDYNLDPRWIADIPDIPLAMRYLGYKGVLMLHPELDEKKQHLAQFRKSMKKFNTTADRTFSVVGHSKPYSFGRLNNDIIVLLSSLGISDAAFLLKQQEYFDWVSNASKDPVKALDFLACLEQYALAEKALLDGVDSEGVKREIRRLQNAEVAGARQELTKKFKSRMIIHKSRRLYGVCDPFQVLKEGEVHIRITVSRKGPATPIHGDVIIVRNPCLHPGDILKLRAVHHPKLSHLVDCLVFASVARPGHKAAPSMSSGGDLDGDEFFVCWDSDLVPKTIAESYDYPGNREFTKKEVTREDLAAHFASYNASGVAKVSALHAKWSRSSPLGALCVQCQELNALHSQSVDGANIKIPDRLATPPEPTENSGPKYILDQLEEATDQFATRFAESASRRVEIAALDQEEGELLLGQLLQSKQNSISEFELFNLAYRLSVKHKIDIRPYLAQLDFSALTTAQKHVMSSTLALSAIDCPEIWNSLVRSDILTPRDLYQRNLAQPFTLHRLYSSRLSGLTTFFEYLQMATQDYTRKVLIIQTDKRFAVGIFMRGQIPWDEDPEVNENVVVCSFMPNTASTPATLRPCTTGYRLHCSDYRLQLYNKQIADTFIFVNRASSALGTEVSTSIALQKISRTVQNQLGRVNRTPVIAIELHVVSNRDRVAHQLFDLWFEHVPTEEHVRRFQRVPVPYRFNDLEDVDWDSEEAGGLKEVFYRNIPGIPLWSNKQKHDAQSMAACLSRRMKPEIDIIMNFAIKYHAEHELFLVFDREISNSRCLFHSSRLDREISSVDVRSPESLSTG
ncbi:RNA dependent RNA polymerase-domain-containing protein [Flammula alnicola]|nr:RNA dependent RNA polymerase-domain-containing protein [Flammula alnicola]